ncbi:MAG TPA: hypothetical protein VNU44_02995 [Bryobacteraceae bacterium]|nr:hypothetical protein [Bryobacteraceae bacterium]
MMGSHFFPRSFRAILAFGFLFGICRNVCFAPQTPPEPNRVERRRLAEKFVQEKLPYWRRRLALEDWNISIFAVHPSDLRPRTLGNVHWDKEKKTAVIRVLDASDYQMPFRATLNDLEFTIVHELIHLELASLPRSEASRSDEEHAVNRLGEALIKLERTGKQPIAPVKTR